MRRLKSVVAFFCGLTFAAGSALAQNSGQRLELDRTGETIVLEPYAPNILRVTLSLKRDAALAGPGVNPVG